MSDLIERSRAFDRAKHAPAKTLIKRYGVVRAVQRITTRTPDEYDPPAGERQVWESDGRWPESTPRYRETWTSDNGSCVTYVMGRTWDPPMRLNHLIERARDHEYGRSPEGPSYSDTFQRELNAKSAERLRALLGDEGFTDAIEMVERNRIAMAESEEWSSYVPYQQRPEKED